MSDFTLEMAARMQELLTRFKLPTVATEVIRRLTDAGHEVALPTLLEVYEAEADERGQRRTQRLLKASRLPSGKTFAMLDRTRVPRQVVVKLDELATGDFLERAANGAPSSERATRRDLWNFEARTSSVRSEAS